MCKDYTPTKKSKKCIYYQTVAPKIGLCLCKYKLTFLCHYSEFYLGKYEGDSEIIDPDDLKNGNK